VDDAEPARGASRLSRLTPATLLLAGRRGLPGFALHATQRREQLTLELAILIEQKTAKIIQLLDESRRDNPQVHDRHDPEAEAMAQPADPGSVLVAIRETHVEAEQLESIALNEGEVGTHAWHDYLLSC
jgi:uncharacterized membrane protein